MARSAILWKTGTMMYHHQSRRRRSKPFLSKFPLNSRPRPVPCFSRSFCMRREASCRFFRRLCIAISSPHSRTCRLHLTYFRFAHFASPAALFSLCNLLLLLSLKSPQLPLRSISVETSQTVPTIITTWIQRQLSKNWFLAVSRV